MTAPASHASFLTHGLDLTTDQFSEAEKAETLAWYREFHDHGELDLSPFARFMVEHDPTGFKRVRRQLHAFDEAGDDSPLPVAAGVLMYVHAYVVLGMGKGALYEIVTMRKLGASRAEIIETIRLGAFHGGPRGINALAEVADDYLRAWPDDGAPSSVAWPQAWAPDIATFRSGIDLATDELLPGELELVEDWYERMTGDVPAHVPFLSRTHPRALKTQRARFETTIAGALPAQMIPLLMLHLAAIRLWPKPLRRALTLARAVGVTRREAVTALLWAAVYGTDVVMETAFDAAGDLLEGWS